MDAPLAQLGLAGLVISVLAGVVVYQNRKIEGFYKKTEELQDKRYTELATITEKYNEAMSNFSRVTELLFSKLGSK